MISKSCDKNARKSISQGQHMHCWDPVRGRLFLCEGTY